MIKHPVKVFFMIRFEQKFSLFGQGAVNDGNKGILNQSVLEMTRFGPGVGEQIMQARDTARHHEPFEEIGAFEPQYFYVGQLFVIRAGTNAAHAPQKALDTQKAAVGIMSRHLQKEAAIAAPHIDFKRSVHPENFFGTVPVKIVLGYESRAVGHRGINCRITPCLSNMIWPGAMNGMPRPVLPLLILSYPFFIREYF